MESFQRTFFGTLILKTVYEHKHRGRLLQQEMVKGGGGVFRELVSSGGFYLNVGGGMRAEGPEAVGEAHGDSPAYKIRRHEVDLHPDWIRTWGYGPKMSACDGIGVRGQIQQHEWTSEWQDSPACPQASLALGLVWLERKRNRVGRCWLWLWLGERGVLGWILSDGWTDGWAGWLAFMFAGGGERGERGERGWLILGEGRLVILNSLRS